MGLVVSASTEVYAECAIMLDSSLFTVFSFVEICGFILLGGDSLPYYKLIDLTQYNKLKWKPIFFHLSL